MVILDYGHGYDTEGKSYAGFEEWNFNRKVGRYIELELHHRKIPYHVLVPEKRDIGLKTRVERAEAIDHDLLISIHGNAFKDDLSVSGIETWYYSKVGKKCAQVLQDKLIQRMGWNDRGIKKGNFTIVKKTPITAILSENGFYTNHADRILMSDDFWQYSIAMSHAEAIEEILNSNII